MRRVRDVAVGIWEFVAGDDWMTAAGVVVALGLTGLIDDSDAAWVVMPLAVALLLAVSIRRRTR
ncbi:MAG TPA: hypothetical protein VHR38_11440 [Solirubrobacterales bacterium]|jgi:hypothetical protein|nr:hypothetical protein [Solirubrobacterales bacterium]